MKKISIIFSFRNEEKNIPELVNRTSKVFDKLKNWEYELVFVNDSSSDSSENILLDLQKNFPIKIINMSRKFGVQPCILAGFENCSGDCVVYMDADLQDPPELIPKLIDRYEDGFEVVHTKRIKRLGESKIKMFFTTQAYKIINFFSDIPLQTNAGDFKLISKNVIDIIKKQKEFNPYIRGLSVWVGLNQTYVEYIREPRFSGKTNFTLFSSRPAAEFIRGITSYSLAPLYFGIILGVITFLFSLLLVLYALYAKFTGLAVAGTTGIIITISLFSGIILITLGIIGIYLAKIFEQIRGRPRYIIKEIKNYKKNE